MTHQNGKPVSASRRTRMRHGLRAGRLPAGCAAIRRSIDELRRQLEDAVIAAHGEIDIVAAAQIQTAIRWERHAMLAQRWLRLNADALEPSERLKYSSDIARASTERDKVIAALKLTAHKDEFDPTAELRARASQIRPHRIEKTEQVSGVMFVQETQDGAVLEPREAGDK